MKKTLEYIIVGFGIAGICIAKRLEEKKKSFLVISSDSIPSASMVSGGIINTINLRNIIPLDGINDYYEELSCFYSKLENDLNSNFIREIRIDKIFETPQYQKNWINNSYIFPYLISKQMGKKLQGLNAMFGYGQVKNSFLLDFNILHKSYKNYLKKRDMFLDEKFDYSSLIDSRQSNVYKDIKFDNIIFCEGFGIRNNPFFQGINLNYNKGEYLIISCRELDQHRAIKGKFFILPLGNNLFKVGATFIHRDNNYKITEKSKLEIDNFLKESISCPYLIEDQIAGMRITTIDNSPIFIRHDQFSNYYIFNGLGSKGFLTSPLFSKNLELI